MSSTQIQNVYPLTDGTNVVWRRRDATNGYVVLNDGDGEETLTKGFPFASWPPGSSHDLWPGPDYQVAGGWVAYRDVGNAGQLHVWRRSPTGQKSQLSFFGSGSELQVLNERGDVLWAHGGQRYLNERNLGTFLGQPAFKDGQWHFVIGNELFLLNEEAPLSIETAGDSVTITGSGVLEGSANLTDWTEVGRVEGTMSIPRDTAGVAQFYRLKR